MKNTLSNKIIIFSFLLLFCTILVNSFIHTVGFQRDYMNARVIQSQTIGMAMKGSIERLLASGKGLGQLPGLTEKCFEMVQANPEVSFCVVTDGVQRVLFSSEPKFAAIRFDLKFDRLTRVFDERVSLVTLGDETFFNTSVPVKSPDGSYGGFVQVGFHTDEITHKLSEVLIYDLILLLVSFCGAFYLVIRFSRRNILRPMNLLLDCVKKITSRDFAEPVPDLGVNEFNELARNINTMAVALREREGELQRNYEELATTHQKLQISYLQLEGLSLEVEQSEDLYKSLMDDSSDAIIVVDDREQVKMVNKMAVEFFGYSTGELKGLPITKMLLLLNIENIPRIHRLFGEALEGRHIVEEIVFSKKSGEAIVGRMNLSSIKNGEETLVQGVFRDITKEKEILDNLSRSAADLARLNKMKDSFLGLASHELKTPLTVIMGYTDLLLSDMADSLEPTVQEMVKNISNAANRLDSIVKDMVDVSMIDEKRLNLRWQEVNLNRLMETVAAELRFFFSMRKQDLVMHLDPTIPNIEADELRLMQVFSNVLGNAIKFTPDGGTITVTTNAKYLSRLQGPDDHAAEGGGREPKLFVEVTIHDTGIGIDRDEQVRIFEKFYESGNIAEHSTGKVAFKAKGAGLGLTIAKGIIEVHGGDIWVESSGYNPEQFPGSTFHILLPVSQAAHSSGIDFSLLMN